MVDMYATRLCHVVETYGPAKYKACCKRLVILQLRRKVWQLSKPLDGTYRQLQDTLSSIDCSGQILL